MATISNNDLAQNLHQLVAAFVQAAQQMVLAAVAEGLAVKPDALRYRPRPVAFRV